jgi:hypothetical protein
LIEQERRQKYRIRNYLKAVGVEATEETIDQIRPAEPPTTHWLRTLAQEVGWSSATLPAPLRSATTPSFTSYFYPLLEQEDPELIRFNPTWVAEYHIYLYRTKRRGTDAVGYEVLHTGEFGLHRTVSQVEQCILGVAYSPPRERQATRDHPCFEDLRYVGMHRKRVFLSGSVSYYDVDGIMIYVDAALFELQAVPQNPGLPWRLNCLKVFESPAKRGIWEKNWLWSIEAASHLEGSPTFYILYNFEPALFALRYRLAWDILEKLDSSPLRLSPPAHIRTTPLRGSALLKLTTGVHGESTPLPHPAYMLLTHRRTADMHYLYYLSFLSPDFLEQHSHPLPILMDKPFRILFVLSAHLSVDGKAVAFCCGIEDEIACIFVYPLSQLLQLAHGVGSDVGDRSHAGVGSKVGDRGNAGGSA